MKDELLMYTLIQSVINTVPFMRTGPISMLCELPVPKTYVHHRFTSPTSFLSIHRRINKICRYEEVILLQRQIVIPYRETNPQFISEPYWSSTPKKKYIIQFCGSISRYSIHNIK